MKMFVCDCEVFSHDWLVVAKDHETGEYTVVLNDNAALTEFIGENGDSIFGGFNMKHYDSHIIKALCCGADNAQIKEINDFIIHGGQGWEHPFIRDNYFYFNTFDIKDDMQMGLSLKAIEGHMSLPIVESSVSFDIDRPLTSEEINEIVEYCKTDVDRTENLIGLRKEYLKGKLSIGRLKNIPDAKSLYMTNAKLTAAFLDAKRLDHNDERDYQYPSNLQKEFVPPEVFSFFDKMRDPSVSSNELFESKIDFVVAGCPCVVGFGGIHGAIPNYLEEAKGTRTIRNYDVASLYPSLMINCGYTSRNIPSAEHYKEVYITRLNAKKNGDKVTANTLKLVLNTTYGAMLNKFNDLYDPRMGRSVCISGQLFLLELASRYVAECKSITLIQLNTDGIMVSLEESELPILAAINNEWQTRTGFALEEDVIKKIAQKDVNNYLMVGQDGKPKTKGGYLTYGINGYAMEDVLSGKQAPQGVFNINNNAIIVRKAIMAYFIKGTPVEETIAACDNIFEYQIIAKAGAKYREAYHLVDDVPQPIQKVNRVYATADTRYGKLFKVKAEDESTAKIEMLPEHCIIDNNNQLSIVDIDKSFYIEMAKKRINDFLGIKPEKVKKERMKKNMATKNDAKTPEQKEVINPEALNVYQKLLKARVAFLSGGVKKSGKNMKLSYKYYELDDIVPAATPIFEQLGLLPIVTYSDEVAVMTMVNTDKPEETIVFTSPMREIEAITSNRTGGEVTNAMQRLGSVETYQRRYLYMAALDIVEADSIDSGNGDENPPTPQPHLPVSPDKREDVKKTLTDKDGAATELQVKQLKEALKKLREVDSEQEDYIAQIAVKTEGFTNITKTACETLMLGIADMIEEKSAATEE